MERIADEISKLSLKIDDLKNVIDKFFSIRNLDISEIEIASAKTITDITKNLLKRLKLALVKSKIKIVKKVNIKVYNFTHLQILKKQLETKIF